MRSIGRAFLLIAIAAVPAAAQPQPNTNPPSDTPPTDSPSWLPGVEDVTGNIPEPPSNVVLTLDKAVQLALQVQPSLRQARALTEAAYGRADQARVAEHPTVALSASIGANSSRQGACSNVATGVIDAMGTCGGFLTGSAAFNVGASASYRIYDFGQTAANVRAAVLTGDATAATIATNTLDVRKAVESAYLQEVADLRLVKVAEATVKSEAGHLDQAKRFVAAQAHDPIEVAQAQSRFANAKSALAQAQSNEAIALATLRFAIGWLDPTRLPVVDPNWPEPPTQDPPALSTLVQAARKNRPEIVQFDKQVLAAEATVEAAHDERRPVLSAAAGILWSPVSGDYDPQPSWSAALTLSWNLWDGGKSFADARVAKANVTANEAERDALLVQLTSDLDSARSQIIANRANVQASNEAVVAAQTQLKLSDARYANGLGSQIELADAQTAVTTAEGNLVTAQFQLANAWAQLKRAIGHV
jgi:outer membrane protein